MRIISCPRLPRTSTPVNLLPTAAGPTGGSLTGNIDGEGAVASVARLVQCDVEGSVFAGGKTGVGTLRHGGGVKRVSER